MMGLGEHVEGVDALQGEARLAQMLQIPGEGAGVARNVDDLLRVKVDKGLACTGVETSPGWVQHDQVDRFELIDQTGQNRLNLSFIEADMIKLIQIADKIKTG